MKQFPVKTDYDIIADEIDRIVKSFDADKDGAVLQVGSDVSGVGNSFVDFLRRKGIGVRDVKFSLENKSKMYGNFKLLAEQRRIRICVSDECKKQLGTLIFKKSARDYLTVAHEKESQHDDFPDAICCLIDVSIMPSIYPVTVTKVESKPRGPGQLEDTRDSYIAKTLKETQKYPMGSPMAEIQEFRRQFE